MRDGHLYARCACVQAMSDAMTKWKGTIHGPKDTPYEGGTFVIDIELTSSYPFEPPKMKFDTKVWHPNVSSQTGAICLDILKKEWSPALTIKTALISVQALLAAPEPDDPQDGVVAKEYKTDFEKWKRTAKLWTEQYAMESSDTQVLAPLLEMGFSEEQVRSRFQLHLSSGSPARHADCETAPPFAGQQFLKSDFLPSDIAGSESVVRCWR